MVKPINPAQAKELKKNSIPDFIIEVVNELLVKNYNDYRIVLTQVEVISAIIEKHPNYNRAEIFANKWLDFEDLFRQNGWAVKYDKPGYNESYEAYFEFKPKGSLNDW